MKTGYEPSLPSPQNAIDIIPEWTSLFPANVGVKAGATPLFDDERINWALSRFGDVAGKRVLELGPLEGAHTTMLARKGARVDAVEANRVAYLKCLITKEILQIPNTRFHLGDCVAFVDKTASRYDLVVACGVLYHMEDPVRLLRALARLTDNLYLWTVYVDEPDLPVSAVQRIGNVDVRTYVIDYGPKGFGFCGGALGNASWMNKSDIVAVLKCFGFADVTIAHDRPKGADGAPATFSVYARRTRSGVWRSKVASLWRSRRPQARP